jgi:hypothetical protein
MFHGTLVSEDGRAAGVYVPIVDKNDSYRISTEIQASSTRWKVTMNSTSPASRSPRIPFGVEMFQQMAVSAPLAGLLIFLIMLYFFRSVPLVVAPMILAMVTVIATMGLLIGTGLHRAHHELDDPDLPDADRGGRLGARAVGLYRPLRRRRRPARGHGRGHAEPVQAGDLHRADHHRGFRLTDPDPDSTGPGLRLPSSPWVCCWPWS